MIFTLSKSCWHNVIFIVYQFAHLLSVAKNTLTYTLAKLLFYKVPSSCRYSPMWFW